MGVDIYAYSIIGVKIDFETLLALSGITTLPGCQCGVVTREDQFCRKCGKQAWVTQQDMDAEEVVEAMCSEFGVNSMICHNREVAYIGEISEAVHHESHNPEKCMPINTREQGIGRVAEVHAKLTRMCHQHKLGSMASMGFWVVMDISV